MEPPNSPKIRLMCSYGGHIVPRPHDRSLFYAAGDNRIIAVDRRSNAAASISALKSHISRSLFNNRPFHLKYQLPNEDLDSLISVVTDEDLSNMIDEYDRISEQQGGRIRLFLFPIKAESLNSGVFGDKSESWFCDALKNTRITRSADESGVGKAVGVGGAESLVLETSSSFGSTGSSLCMSNSPPVGGGVGCEETAGLSLLDRMIRVPSSASIESDYSVGVALPAPKTGTCQEEPLIQVDDPEPPSLLIGAENTAYTPPISVPMQSGVQVLGYPVSQQPDGKQMQSEAPLVQGGFHYVPQYPASSVPRVRMPSYYPYYQMPVQQQQIPCTSNQQYPIYFVPVRPAQYHNMSNPYNFIDTTYTSRPTLYPQTAVISPPFVQKELFGVQTVTQSATIVHHGVSATTPLISIPSNQGQLMTEQQNLFEPVTSTSVASSTQSSEFDEDIVYNQVYKTQPLAPLLASHYQAVTKGVNAMLSESSVQMQANHAKQQAAVHPL